MTNWSHANYTELMQPYRTINIQEFTAPAWALYLSKTMIPTGYLCIRHLCIAPAKNVKLQPELHAGHNNDKDLREWCPRAWYRRAVHAQPASFAAAASALNTQWKRQSIRSLRLIWPVTRTDHSFRRKCAESGVPRGCSGPPPPM